MKGNVRHEALPEVPTPNVIEPSEVGILNVVEVYIRKELPLKFKQSKSCQTQIEEFSSI